MEVSGGRGTIVVVRLLVEGEGGERLLRGSGEDVREVAAGV